MEWDYIVVQAGGKGTRMKSLTRNKPKALVPVDNLPILFHLFKKYPNKKFIIIGDYKLDVMERYLAVYAHVDYRILNAAGKQGTCAGLSEALTMIPDSVPFMLIWCDLLLNEDFDISRLRQGNYVGTSLGFPCRWKYENGMFSEEVSSTCGVAGLFFFEDKSVLQGIPPEGEFVRWISQRQIKFDTVVLDGTREYGLIESYRKLEHAKCRPFNKITDYGSYIVKEGIDEQGQSLAIRERAWYEQVQERGFKNLPEIYDLNPLKLEKIHGKNIYEYSDISFGQKKIILSKIIKCLKELHELGHCSYDENSFFDAYIVKTVDRLKSIQELVPFAKEPHITINGKSCRNIFFHVDEVAEKIKQFKPDEFCFIHGDCTFSNMLMREEDEEPVLIDPRGYFGHTQFYGDVAYDYAKLYYSIVGNYDRFNLKQFELYINERDVELTIQSNQWENLESYFFELVGTEVKQEQIKLIHAIIWLSLTTYAWEDYDSICGAFYNGVWYLEDVL